MKIAIQKAPTSPLATAADTVVVFVSQYASEQDLRNLPGWVTLGPVDSVYFFMRCIECIPDHPSRRPGLEEALDAFHLLKEHDWEMALGAAITKRF